MQYRKLDTKPGVTYTMLRRAWQASMIGLARSGAVKRLMQGSRAGSFLAGKYVAGQSTEAAVQRTLDLLNVHGIRGSLFCLGEYVDNPRIITETLANKTAAARALKKAGLDIHISVDPTQIGQSIEPEMARRNALAIAEQIAKQIANAGNRKAEVNCLMLDMEDASVVDATIAMHDDLKDKNLPVALTLQAYLKRTEADLARQVAKGSKVRLVKGAFVDGSGLAFTKQKAIRANYKHLLDIMFSKQAMGSGFYPIVASHDEANHDHAIALAKQNGWAPGSYEFEMLLGVRGEIAERLAKRGERVRLYVPFGRDWWPHAVRRIGENPRNAVLLMRSLFS